MNGKPQPRYSVRATSQREYKGGLAVRPAPVQQRAVCAMLS